MLDRGFFVLEREDVALECIRLKIMKSIWFTQVKQNKEKTVALPQLKLTKKDYVIMTQNSQLL